MKAKVALFVNGWNGDNIDNFIDGFNSLFSKDDIDLFVFTSYSGSVDSEKMNEAEDSIYSLADELLNDIENEKTYDKDWAMLMIDLNGLKITNDQYGHEAGDELIKGTATVISDIYAERGECFRIGGDEFVVVIDADEEHMLEYRNKLKARMDEYNRVEVYKISMAVGESRLNNKDGVRGSISDWKMNADMDMYREKDGFHKATRRILYSNIN